MIALTLFPMIARELRIESRRPINFALRLLAAGLTFFVFIGLASRDHQSAELLGARLFPRFHTLLLFTVWLISPLLTADSLAQERREGTLDLLLLTKLTPGGIVAAKSFVHALRGLAMLLAALPLLCIPFFLGGVSPSETLISAMLCLAILILGMAAGVLASAFTSAAVRAILLALAFSTLFCLGFCALYFWCYQAGIASLIPANGIPQPALTLFSFTGWSFLTDADGKWGLTMAQLPPGGDTAWVALCEMLLAVAALASALQLQFSGSLIWRRGQGRSKGPARFRECIRCISCCAPWRWRLARRVHVRGNPLFWLQQRTWTSRASKWGWSILVIGVEAVAFLAGGNTSWFGVQLGVGAALVLGIIHASASSYRLEKSNGMLELILTTPLKPWSLVTGRVRSLWQQFAAAAVFWIFWARLMEPLQYQDVALPLFATVVSMMLVAPIVGMDCAVNFRGRWAPILATAMAVLLIPGGIFLFNLTEGHWPPVILSAAILAIIGILTLGGLHLQMRERVLRHLHPHYGKRRRRRRSHRNSLHVPDRFLSEALAARVETRYASSNFRDRRGQR